MAEPFAKSFQVAGYICTVIVDVPHFGTGSRWTTEWEPHPPRRLKEDDLRHYRVEYARAAKELARLLEADRHG